MKVLVNAYFAKNLGDDLFLKVLFDRYPGVNWHLLTPNKEYKQIFHNHNNVKIMNSMSVQIGRRNLNVFKKINDLVLKYRIYDAFLNIGGSVFMQTELWEKALRDRGYLPEIFKKNNKKNFLLGANFGPYKNDLFVEKHQSFFTNFDDICFRDRYSYNLFESLNNVRVAPDVVFNLEINQKVKKGKYIGFSIINLEKREKLKSYNDLYKNKMKEIAVKYANLGYKIRFFSFCESEGDLKAIYKIIERLNLKASTQVEVINYSGNIDKFLHSYRACEVIVGTRFHSIILALKFGQEVYPIIYSDKTSHVLNDLGIENYCYISKIHTLDTDKLVIQVKLNKLKDNKIFYDAKSQFLKLDGFLGKVEQ